MCFQGWMFSRLCPGHRATLENHLSAKSSIRLLTAVPCTVVHAGESVEPRSSRSALAKQWDLSQGKKPQLATGIDGKSHINGDRKVELVFDVRICEHVFPIWVALVHPVFEEVFQKTGQKDSTFYSAFGCWNCLTSHHLILCCLLLLITYLPLSFQFNFICSLCLQRCGMHVCIHPGLYAEQVLLPHSYMPRPFYFVFLSFEQGLASFVSLRLAWNV